MTLLRYVGKFEKKIVFETKKNAFKCFFFVSKKIFFSKFFFIFFAKSVRLTEFSFFFPNFPLFLPYYSSHLSRVSRGKWLFFSPKFCVGVCWCLLATHRASTPPQEVSMRGRRPVGRRPRKFFYIPDPLWKPDFLTDFRKLAFAKPQMGARNFW